MQNELNINYMSLFSVNNVTAIVFIVFSQKTMANC